jgi:hypothetical protein
VYAFAHERSPWEIDLATVTEAQLAPFIERARALRRSPAVANGPVREGGRHRHLLRLGGAMRRVGACEEAIVAALIAENVCVCEPPQDERLVRALAHDTAARYQPETA